MTVRLTVEIADEDWKDPAFKEVWEEMVDEGIIRVVRIEKKVGGGPHGHRRETVV